MLTIFAAPRLAQADRRGYRDAHGNERAMIQDDRKGLLAALCGFAMLASADIVTKAIAPLWAPVAMAAMRFSLGAIGLAILVLIREGPSGLAFPRPAVQLLRGAGIAIAGGSFFASLSFMPLAVATTIVFTSPIITALMSALFLGERLRRQTFFAIGLAMAGILLILRPGFDAFGPGILLPLVAAGGMSMLIIGNRLSAGLASTLSMQFTSACIGGGLLILMAIAAHMAGLPRSTIAAPPPDIVVGGAIVVAIVASTAHGLVFMATARAGAATIAPMTYVQLLVVVAAGWAIFGNVPDRVTIAGAALIVGAGLYLWAATRTGPVEPAP